MEIRELRIGNWVKTCVPDMEIMIPHVNTQVQGITLFGEVLFYHSLEHSGFKMHQNHITGIEITPEILEKAGFTKLPHFTVQDIWHKELGRDRFLSVACVGTGNEMIFITEEVPPEVKSIIVARNYDYEGKTYLHQLQNIHFALTGTELNIQL